MARTCVAIGRLYIYIGWCYCLGLCIVCGTGRIILLSWGLFIMCGTGSDQ